MAHNDEGEFELVIGNRQLLLVFGVLLVLLGVLFTMGYLIGKNNPSKEAITAFNNRQVPIIGGSGSGSSGSPIIVDPGKQNDEKPPSRSATELYERATTKDAPKEVVKEAPLPEVPKVPKDVEKKKEEPKREAKKEPPPPEPKMAEPPKPRPVATGSVSTPGPGTYMQVVAVDLEGANSWVGTLRGKSFSAVVAPGPNDKLFRVLIGPIKDKEALGQTKIELEKLGVKGAFVKKY